MSRAWRACVLLCFGYSHGCVLGVPKCLRVRVVGVLDVLAG